MSFDQNALDSLRIERTTEPGQHGGRAALYKWLSSACSCSRSPSGAVCTVARQRHRSGNGDRGASLVERRRRRRRGAQCVGLRRRAAPGHGVLEGHRQGRRSADRGRHGGQGRPAARAARRHDDHARSTRSSQRQLEAARKNLEEVEVRLAEAERNLRRTEQLRKDKLVSELQLDQAQSEVAALSARLEALKSEVQVAEGTRARARAGSRRPAGARAVRRRRRLEGCAARRNGVADVGRRRLHAHRHRDHRRHGFARDRSRRQRGVHQPRQGRIRRPRRCSMPIRTGSFPAT